MSHIVSAIVAHGGAVKEFELRRADGGALPDWQAGAHITLQFAAADGRQFEQHYSLIGKPGAASAYRIAVQREAQGKGGSRCLHDEFTVGSTLRIGGPFNSFPLTPPVADTPARVLLVAGGIGLTPLLSMAHALDALGVPFELHYLVHDADRLVLTEALTGMRHATLRPHISQQSGRADLSQLLGAYGAGDQLYACGPAGLLQGLAAAGSRQGWPAAALHFESFGARLQQDDAALTVELSLSQMTLEVQPGRSILDALIAADVFVSYDCKRGECGNCYTPVEHGQPIHRDVCLTPAMRAGGMCTCVSWAGGDSKLVLAL
jgi:vanillate O-demethylase ferredoxin subunit